MTIESSFKKLYCSVTSVQAKWVEGGNLDLSYKDMLYLEMISLTEGCTVSSLSEAMGVSPSAVTRRLNSLESRGLVTRTRQEDDSRFKTVEVSDKARDVLDDADRVFKAVLSDMEGEFSESDREVFCRMMDRMSDIIGERGSSLGRM